MFMMENHFNFNPENKQRLKNALQNLKHKKASKIAEFIGVFKNTYTYYMKAGYLVNKLTKKQQYGQKEHLRYPLCG